MLVISKNKGIVIIALLLHSFYFQAQNIQKQFFKDSISVEKLVSLKNEFGQNKTLIKEYEAQILIALSFYPELKNTAIEFRIKKTKTPLTSKPSFVGLFSSGTKRKYYVTISSSSVSYLEPILLHNLNFNAQIGVLGHELAHIANYIHNGFGKMCNIIGIEAFSKKRVDIFEHNTDLACIRHGLGYQLMDWSKSVREKLGRNNWRGAGNITTNTKVERYMNPESIMSVIKELSIYDTNPSG